MNTKAIKLPRFGGWPRYKPAKLDEAMVKTRILIADDEDGVRESLKLVLKPAYELTFAKHGQEAIRHLQQQRFGLLLLDVKMPKADGIEVLRWVRRHRAKMPVLMLTAYQSVEVAKAAIKLGAVNYVPKPFERAQVLRAVRDALGA